MYRKLYILGELNGWTGLTAAVKATSLRKVPEINRKKLANMMCDQTKRKRPQVGSGWTGESHSSLEDCPMDSGGDNHTFGTKDKLHEDTDENSVFNRRDSIPRMSYEWETVTDPSIRRSSIIRTPPDSLARPSNQIEKHEDNSSVSPDIDTVKNDEVFWDDKISVSPLFELYEKDDDDIDKNVENPVVKKRKIVEHKETRETEELTEMVEMNAALRALESVNRKMSELKAQIKVSTKTKTEIKSITRELNNVLGNLNRKMNILKTSYTDLNTEVIGYRKVMTNTSQTNHTGTQTEVEKRSIGTQADEEEIKNELTRRKANMEQKIESEIRSKTWEGLSKVLDEEWPQDCFKNTEISDLEKLNDSSGDLALIVNPDGKHIEKNLERDLKLLFPGIHILLEEELEEGHIEFIKTQTETILSRGQKKDSSRICYVVPYKINPEGTNDIKNLHHCIKSLHDLVLINSNRPIKIVTAGNIDTNYLRKCTEAVFRGSGIKAQLLTTKKEQFNHIKGKRVEKTQNQKIIVKTNGREYADILREIKRTVKPEEIGVKVEAIRKTGKGDLMVEIQGGKVKAEALRKEIQTKNKDTQVFLKDTDDIIHVMDIEGDVSKEEIEEAIKMNLPSTEKEHIRVLSTRPNRSGGQTATVSTKRGIAREMIQKGVVKIGWTTCRVRIRVNILRCFRCLEFGHHSTVCKGDDNSKLCLNCGKEEHKAKFCKNESWCITCKTTGHRADQTRCPNYRRLIREKSKAVETQNRGRLISTASNHQ